MTYDTTHKGLRIRIRPLAYKVTFEIEVESTQATTERTHTIFGRRITRSAKGTCFHREGRAFFVDATELEAAIAAAHLRMEADFIAASRAISEAGF